jgi:C-terminal processing protease CtpA/Prc
MTLYHRLSLYATLLLLFATTTTGNAQSKYEQDFLSFWGNFNDYYPYFDKQKIDWNKVKEIYQPQAAAVKDDTGFFRFMDSVLNELHNGHVSLNNNIASSNRILPSGSDVFAERRGTGIIITDVRQNSGAELCGLEPGMEVVAFNGKAIAGQADKFLPKSVTAFTPAMQAYALNMLLAGTYDTPREITIADNGTTRTFYPDKATPAKPAGVLEYKLLANNTAYIKINNSLGDYALIPQFDAAIDKLMDTKALILDLTDTPGGGNSTVARAIMGRLTSKELPYQKHVIDEKQYGTTRSWIEYVLPRKTAYKKEVVLMVGHWTGSMGEGIAIGLDAMKRAKVTGTKMAGLLGAVYSFRMPNTNIGYQVPGEKMYHVNGTPREDYIPKYLTKTSRETYVEALRLVGD